MEKDRKRGRQRYGEREERVKISDKKTRIYVHEKSYSKKESSFQKNTRMVMQKNKHSN